MLKPSNYRDYEAPISTMRELTKRGEPFQIEFIKLSGERRIIKSALLRKQSKGKYDRNSAHKLQFIDTQSDQLGSCFIPLITALNDKKIILDE